MRKNYKLYFSVLFILFAAGCADKPFYKETRLMMGTFVEITCQDRGAINSAFEEIKNIEKVANIFDPDSEVSRLNKKGGIQASRHLLNLVSESLKIYELSSGAFDITIAPAAKIWKEKIGEKHIESLPSDEEIKTALSVVGSDKIFLDKKRPLIKFLKPGMQIDLGGIAKGYAADQAISRLRRQGVSSALVNIGGNIFCLGKKNGKKWHIGIRHPHHLRQTIFDIDLENQAVATSAEYEQYFVYGNKKYSHIIDPETGYPVDNGVISVTVIAPNAALADALSTALFVMGRDHALALVRKLGNVQVKILTNF